MNQATVKFSKEFITPSGLKEWVGIEWPVGLEVDRDAIFATLDKVRDAVLDWHQKNNTQPTYMDAGLGPLPVKWANAEPLTPDPEFEELKRRLGHMEYREDAIDLINNNGFRLNVELNKIANAKPSRDAHS